MMEDGQKQQPSERKQRTDFITTEEKVIEKRQLAARFELVGQFELLDERDLDSVD